MAWATPAAGLPYEALFLEASELHQLPAGLLSRVAWEESHYNPLAFNAATGASGIMQIIPRWHPGVDVWDPAAAIPYAAGYLRENFDRFGSWALALAAYNAGPGNVERYGGVPPFPETVEYVNAILADVAVPASASGGAAVALLALGLIVARARGGR